MAASTVRPFTAMGQRHVGMSLRSAQCTRVLLRPLAARKGFGDQKKEQTKRPEAPAQQGLTGSPPAALDAPQQQQQQQRPMGSRGRVVQETPQVVVDRIFNRILVCTGLPVFTGMALYPLFYYLRVVQDIDYPLWIVYVAQVITFGGGLLGITYGAMSASWDPSREGSALGWTEIQANMTVLLNRNKQQE